MAHFVDDEKFLNDNVAEFAKKIESQFSIFLDKTPTFVDYFHINAVESTKDTGLQTVEKLTGVNAATKYNMIKDFPIYGIEQIVLSLSDDDVKGLDTEYEGEAIILPNTVVPMTDDYFMIRSVGKKFFFRVTETSFDTIKSNNFYKISFTIKAADDETYYESFVEQTKEVYRTIFRNYGTDDKFIIQEEDFLTMAKVDKMYIDISKRYMRTFYNNKYNCLMIQDPQGTSFIYDAFVNIFCNNETIFAVKDRDLDNMKFYEESRADFDYLYHSASIQSVILNKDMELFRSEDFKKFYDQIPTFQDSIFKYYGEYTINGVTLRQTNISPFGVTLSPVVSDELLENIDKGNTESGNVVYDSLVNYMKDDIKFVGKLLSDEKSRVFVRNNYESYVIIPMFLFVIHQYYNYLAKKVN